MLRVFCATGVFILPGQGVVGECMMVDGRHGSEGHEVKGKEGADENPIRASSVLIVVFCAIY